MNYHKSRIFLSRMDETSCNILQYPKNKTSQFSLLIYKIGYLVFISKFIEY